MKEYLVRLADTYENADFLKKDPSQFMHRFSEAADIETAAFIASSLAFGRRGQILSHCEQIFELCEKDKKTPSKWILDADFLESFPKSPKSFYRMFSFSDMRILFSELRSMLLKEKTLGEYFRKRYEKNSGEYLHRIIADSFSEECRIVCHGKTSAAKRINMFLRWMVRKNSPVDMGLWTWYDMAKLIIPLDTHVMQESVSLGLIKKSAQGKIPGANLKNALALTQKMSEYFPSDPARADFALFGLGVDDSRKRTS